MPGIYGIVNSKNIKNNLECMAKEMHLYDHFIQDKIFYDEKVGASRAHTGQVGEASSPVKQDNYAVWVEGEAYNISEVAAELTLDASTLASLLLEAEKADLLDNCLNKLDGYFCAALYTCDTQKVKLISDRYGMRLLYWYHKDGVFTWGSEVKAILAVDGVDKTLNPNSYNCFMDLGYLLGEHTWFEHIKLIKPATVIEYDITSDKCNQHHYWKWSEIKPSSLSFDEAVDELGRRFIDAVEKRFDPKDKIGISLSGGLDSRVIFAAVEHLYPDYAGYAFTFGVPNCDDITIAEQVIARAKNWKHEKFYFSSDNWFQPRIERIWNTDGMQDMLHMHGSEFLSEVHRNITVNLNGYAGDAVLGGGFLARIPWNQRISSTNSTPFYKNYSNLTDIDNDFYDIDCVEPHLYMNRVRRFTIYGSINALSRIEQRKPFFDNKIIELVFALPDEYRANNRLYSAMLQKHFPKYFKDIPWQQTGKPAGITKKATIARRAIRKGIRELKSFLGLKSTLGYTDYPAWIRDKDVAAQLTELLNPETARYKLLTNENLAKRWLEPHLKSKLANNSNEILRVATIELYLRKALN